MPRQVIIHTLAFDRMRTEAQRYLDFVVLVANAVPNLRSTLTAPGIDLSTLKLNAPDYFKSKGCEPDRLARLLPGYDEELARVSVITLYSYFEAYFKGVLGEIIAFHGGETAFVKRAEQRARKFLAVPQSVKADKRKLQEPEKSGNADKYRKHTKVLVKEGFRFPTELLSSYGVKMLVRKAHPKKGLKAWEIQDILADALHFDVPPSMRTRLDDIRELRNHIAHGDAPAVTLREAMAVARELHTFAAEIDKHLVEHFFVLEAYA